MTLDEFNVQPDQREYAGWLGRPLQEFASEYAQFSNDPLDVMPQASKDNTAQEVVQLATLNTRYAFSLSGDDREKWAIALYHGGENSRFYKGLEAVLSTTPDNLTASSMGYKKDYPVENNVIKNASPVTTGFDGEPTMPVTFVDNTTGIQNTITFFLVTIPTSTGSFQTWME